MFLEEVPESGDEIAARSRWGRPHRRSIAQLNEWLTGTRPEEMISLRAVISGKTMFLVLKDWSLKPRYQYCWF